MADTSRDNAPRWLILSIQGLIVLSIVTIILESMPGLSQYQSYFDECERLITWIFTVEYIGFWWASSNKKRYPFQVFNLIDLLAILPFYLQAGYDLRSLRSL